jgi:chorismate mutase
MSIPLLAILLAPALVSCADAPQTETQDPARREASTPADTESQEAARKELTEWRNRIDTLDNELVALLNRRAEYVLQLAPLKRQIGVAVQDAGREQEVRDKLRAANSGPLPDESLEQIYAAIMAAMRDLQSQD